MTAVALPLCVLLGFLLADAGGSSAMLALAGLAAGLAAVAFPGARRVLAIAVVLLLAGFWRADGGRVPAAVSPVFGSGKAATYRATVVGAPSLRPDRTRARLKLAANGAVIDASLPPYPAVAAGDLVRIRATLPVGGQAASLPVYVTSVTVVGSTANLFVHWRTRLTASIGATLTAAIPEPAGSLALGVVTGDDSGMSPAVADAFRRAGLSHITAVSGWNLSIVAWTALLLLRAGSLPPWSRLLLALVAIWATAFLVGLVPSAIRAAAMMSLFALGRFRGRPADLTVTMLWAVALVLAVTPAIRFDVGFQLSVAATLALALISPLLVDRSRWLVAVAVPAAAEIAVTPLALYHFGTYSLIAPLSNLLVEMLVTPIMAGGVLLVVAHAIHPVAAEITASLTWLPARLVVLVAETTSRLPYASGRTVGLSWSGTVVGYALLLSAWFGWRWRDDWSAWLMGA